MDINKILKNLLFYSKPNGKSQIFDYYKNLDKKIKIKIALYISLLIANNNRLGMPYSRHILDKIWELRVDFDKNYYRIFYFVFTKKQIIFLHGFNKKTNKTPSREIKKAKNNYDDFINNLNFTKL